jgi:hypothetical protein
MCDCDASLLLSPLGVMEELVVVADLKNLESLTPLAHHCVAAFVDTWLEGALSHLSLLSLTAKVIKPLHGGLPTPKQGLQGVASIKSGGRQVVGW